MFATTLRLPIAAGVASFACGCAAFAGAVSVSPTRIELSARHSIATLEIRNDGVDTVTMQLERMAWTQPGGEDVYTMNGALIATPSVFELAPHGSQTLRVALRAGAGNTSEQAFRLYASEVLPAQRSSGSGLQMTIRIGVPVFAEISPSESQIHGEILTQADGKLAILLRNSGGHFARAMGIELSNAAGAAIWRTRSPAYLLAGGAHLWVLDTVSAAGIVPSETLQLSVITETGVERLSTRLRP